MIDQRELYDALIEGAKNSKYGRDPQRPDQPGDLRRFFTNVLNENPAAILMLFGEMIQHEVSTEPQINTDNIINDPKPGRLQ
jgi:hypothetical protein